MPVPKLTAPFAPTALMFPFCVSTVWALAALGVFATTVAPWTLALRRVIATKLVPDESLHSFHYGLLEHLRSDTFKTNES
jgi:hypothetical protein